MKNILVLMAVLFVLIFPNQTSLAEKQNKECKTLEQIFKTKVQSEKNLCRVEIARKIIKPEIMGEKSSPESMDLGFHFAFERVDEATMVIGEMALLQEEVNPVIDQLRKGGLEITAIHNHMMHEKPRIMYLHVQGKGDMIRQANMLINAIAATKEQKHQ
ncbi:hypothetical protein A8F94_19415 [Bacillus sp. FJAT-27225]|uniref:DUF1259 domain-containing protein n=1 Tax=Bacillus sp. FJAT-27225 TaxID=1743144 RepID=UPI00080C2515|nr:DUF1259 domain-containing protein [Bacillus sp. FJAT-27225]OCA83270.1 hypothetical protein A8F94_19415 [Bacillus sp. FJAT-27225]